MQIITDDFKKNQQSCKKKKEVEKDKKKAVYGPPADKMQRGRISK